MALTSLEIKHAKEGMHADGNGLYLQVGPTGTKSWIFRYQINGRRREMGLGPLAKKTAVQARADIALLRARLAAKVDPLEERRQDAARECEKSAQSKIQAITFEAVAREFIANKKAEWSNEKHAWQWANGLEKYVFPSMGAVPVGDVTTDLVVGALAPIWLTKNETASRIRQRIEAVLGYAKFKKWRDGQNPAAWSGHLEHTLPKPSRVAAVVHQPALPYTKMGAFLNDLRAADGYGARALEFAILTAARSGEVRGARWDEIDRGEQVWRVPPARMKGKKGQKKEHRVPLSERALRLVDELPRLAGSPLLFPGKDKDVPISDMTLKAAIVRINKRRKAEGLAPWSDENSGRAVVPHGFRSSFRDWAAEVTHYPNEMAELALAHAVGDKVEAAYRRGDMFEKRRQMMDDWARWCELRDGNAVQPIFANAA